MPWITAIVDDLSASAASTSAATVIRTVDTVLREVNASTATSAASNVAVCTVLCFNSFTVKPTAESAVASLAAEAFLPLSPLVEFRKVLLMRFTCAGLSDDFLLPRVLLCAVVDAI
jgi:hypothetical protein